jgi:transcriptional antiterminator NusG
MSNHVEEDKNPFDKDRIEESASATVNGYETMNNDDKTASPTTQAEMSVPEEQEVKSAYESKFFAIRTTGGQERVVANILQNRISAKKLGIYSVLLLDSFKGYIIVEAPDSNVAFEALSGVRHVRGQIRGELPFKDIEGYLIKKPVVTDLSLDDTVEVIAGPFKSMKAKITRVDYEKQEATVVLLDSPYQIPVTVDANYLKKLLH